MTWIALDCDVATNKKIWAFAERLADDENNEMPTGTKTADDFENTAIASVWKILAELPRHAPSGYIGDISDALLERWANWRGIPGSLADAFREIFTSDGLITGWAERNLPIIEHRERERQRAEKRRREQSTENTRTVRGRSTDGPEATDTDTSTSTTRTKAVRKRRAPRTAAVTETSPPEIPEDGPKPLGWLATVAVVWDAKFGAGSFQYGPFGKQLQPLKSRPADEVAAHLAAYLEQTGAQFLSLPKFVATYARWAPEVYDVAKYGPKVDATGVMSDRFDLLTNPDRAAERRRLGVHA